MRAGLPKVCADGTGHGLTSRAADIPCADGPLVAGLGLALHEASPFPALQEQMGFLHARVFLAAVSLLATLGRPQLHIARLPSGKPDVQVSESFLNTYTLGTAAWSPELDAARETTVKDTSAAGRE